jgi:hypothetical protein
MENEEWKMDMFPGAYSDIKPEMDHIAVLHYVLFSFQLQFALLAATGFAA